MDPTSSPLESRHPIAVTPEEPSTPPQLRAAIQAIQEFQFDPGDIARNTEVDDSAALIMFPTRPSAEVPTLSTEAWSFNPKDKPNPISINTARKYLARALEAGPCELPGADIHGYAWMVEKDPIWATRKNTEVVIAPTKPKKETDYSVPKQLAYMDKMQNYVLYHHLIKEAQEKLTTWFGKSMFDDLCIDGILLPTTTPMTLLAHLE